MGEITCPGKIGPYILCETIGQGCFSIVKKAIDRDTRNVVAVKIISRKRLVFDDAFKFELEVAKKVHHKNIVTFYDFLSDTLNYYLIMEFCHGETLQNFLSHQQKLSEPMAAFIFRQILEVVAYLASLNVAHRDIKPENIMIDETFHVKVIDFGFASIDVQGLGRNNQRCGTLCFSAPELLSGQPVDPCISDVWSCGVLLFQLLTGDVPWNNHSDKPIKSQIVLGEYFRPSRFSPELTTLLDGLLCVDPKKRLTAFSALHSEWFNVADVPRPPKMLARYASTEFHMRTPQPISSRLSGSPHAVHQIPKDAGRRLLCVAGRRPLVSFRNI